MSALIKTTPCESCEDRKTLRSYDWEQPDEVICAQSGTDVFECDRVRDAGKLEDIAASFAHQLTEVSDEGMRRELAEAICDAFSNALYDLGGADIAVVEFLRLAGLAGERVAS